MKIMIHLKDKKKFKVIFLMQCSCNVWTVDYNCSEVPTKINGSISLTLIVLGGGGKVRHATQNLVNSARVRTALIKKNPLS